MLLNATGLTKTFGQGAGRVEVLRGVSFSLRAGETLALTGESGSGKSTLMHLVAGLDRPDAGSIDLDGKDIVPMNDASRAAIRRSVVGLVFQQFNLIPSLNVQDNIAFQARLSGRVDTKWIGTLAERLGLHAHLRLYPEQLSGGQQQRVAIGRTLAARPRLVLADEPTGNLDEATGDAVLALMLELVSETGAGLLMVTHSTRLADRMERRIHLSKGRIR